MDTIPQALMQPLELFVYVSLVLVLITGIFLIKLLLDTSNLVNSLQDFIKVTRVELEPAIREINGTLTNINNISSRINSQVDNINSGLEKGGRLISDNSAKVYKNARVMGSQLKETLISVARVLFK